ncbi:Oidioi.mRNA.OKI2018_I69.XSR.g13441.t1.cds [Oikopleura dioica]|uniref:Oidioi.mRNA.OKI2018_I69.XSR.g13441.t1.cds n=1 Tax=Oikopleura dioica TaxID=34765 RepID=A0ABN7S6V5_OIKDI|nr:Oidioi.mRNA.OKI2018_I69.XSR.g13441.t1.cds [Oikopleura dioica]
MLKRIARIFFLVVSVDCIKNTSQKITCSNYKRILSASLATAKDLPLYERTYKYCCELSKTQSSDEEQRIILPSIPPTAKYRAFPVPQQSPQREMWRARFQLQSPKPSKNPKNKAKTVHKCKCDEGWRGKRCTKERKKKKKKQKSKCKNGEESFLNGRSKCICFSGFKGKRCGKRVSNDVISYDPSSYYSSSSVSYQDSEGNFYDSGSHRPTKCSYGNPDRHSTTCWNVRVESKGRRKKRQLKKFRVTCPLHSCAAQQIPKGEEKDKEIQAEISTESPLELTVKTGVIEKHTTEKPLQTTHKTSTTLPSPTILVTTSSSRPKTTTTEKPTTKKSTTTTTTTTKTTIKTTSTTSTFKKSTLKRTSTKSPIVEIEKLFTKATLPPVGEINIESDSTDAEEKSPEGEQGPIYTGRKNKFRLLQKNMAENPEFCGAGELEIRTKRSRKWFRCLCPAHMEGRNCEHQLNYCRLYYAQYQKRPCEHYCENDARSYYCACHSGFMLAENGYSCEGIVNRCLKIAPADYTSTSKYNPFDSFRASDFYKKLLADESESLYRVSRGER